MSKISHFVITYNHETKEWDLDSDSETVQFLGGTVYDTVSGEWETPSGGTEENFTDNQATNILYHAVNELQGVDDV